MEIRGKAVLILRSLKISGVFRNLNLDISNFFLLPTIACSNEAPIGVFALCALC